MSGLTLGIVKLGRCAGKTKYSLVDEKDISLAEYLVFEARLEVDRNGSGTRIVAWAYEMGTGRAAGRYVHDILWEMYRGEVPAGHHVVHVNGITMDNRLENLEVVPSAEGRQSASRGCRKQSTSPQHDLVKSTHHKSHDASHQSMYSLAMQQLPPDPADTFTEQSDVLVTRYVDPNGDILDENDETSTYYECRYPACTALEQEPREFSMCGRCQEARYCGTGCQQKDWAAHKRTCRERRRPRPYTPRGAHCREHSQGGPER